MDGFLCRIFKTKYLVVVYTRRVDRYYGLCGCRYESKTVKHNWGDNLAAKLERLSSVEEAALLIEKGFTPRESHYIYE